MTSSLSFKEIRKFISGNHAELLGDIDAIISFAILLSPLYMRASFQALESGLGFLSDMLGVKSELTSITRKILDKISSPSDADPISKLVRMEAAYGLICYSAFFEALENQFKSLSEKIDFRNHEKIHVIQKAIENLQPNTNIPESEEKILDFGECVESPDLKSSIYLPHPADGFLTQRNNLLPLYEQMAGELKQFIEKLSFWELADDRQHAEIRQALESLPQLSIDYFTALYFGLAESFNEFYVWSNLHEHQDLKQTVVSLTKDVRLYAEIAQAKSREIDVGFTKLEDFSSISS